MLRMRIVRKSAVHVAGGSTLALLAAGDLGCSAPVSSHTAELGESVSQAALDQGYLDFNYQAGTALGLGFVPYSSPDEFVHTDEQLDIRVSAYTLWSRLHPTLPFPSEVNRAAALRAHFRVIFQLRGVTVDELELDLGSFSGSDVWALSATTPSFIVPSAEVDEIAFEVTLSDADDASAVQHLAADAFPSVPVFGGQGPLRHLLFDTSGTSARQRVVERGSLFRNQLFALSYTDWRANSLFDSFNLDRRIGKALNYGRFGTAIIDIYGELVYEVYAGVARDGAGFTEQKLAATKQSRVLPFGQGRTAYEGNVYAHGNAVNLYFHVKAYLVADYSKYNGVTEQWYVDGQRISLGEKWDNEGGRVGDNYDFALADAP